MVLTLSAVLMLGVAAYFILRTRTVSTGAAVVLFLFGFFAAGTGAYGPIHQACTAFATALTHLHA